jgi:hypothetical protein
MNRAIEDSTRGKILKTPGMFLSPVGNLSHISILYATIIFTIFEYMKTGDK